MAWPKGQKRVGHVNADGTAHRKKGEGHIRVIRKDKPVYTQTKTEAEPRIEKTIHGGGSRPIIEVCPNCSFAYADGGWCGECGWTTWQGRKR